MNDTTPAPAAPEPLDDDALRDLRTDLDAGANCVIAYTVRSLLARLDRAEAERDRLRRQLDAAEAADTPEELQQQLADANASISFVYRERAHLVALLAALYPASWQPDPNEGNWPVVYIQLPTGQASWHISPKDWHLFDGTARDDTTIWDGHTTAEKYERIARHAYTRRWARYTSNPDDIELPWHTLIRTIEPDLLTGEIGPAYQLLHPEECRYLPPGAVCWATHDAMNESWPVRNGRYRIRPVTQCTGGYEEPEYQTFLEIEPEPSATAATTTQEGQQQ